jgi:hypothetical protein
VWFGGLFWVIMDSGCVFVCGGERVWRGVGGRWVDRWVVGVGGGWIGME